MLAKATDFQPFVSGSSLIHREEADGIIGKLTLKPVQQANGKRSLKFTKASQAQPSIAKHSQAQPRIASTALCNPARPSLSFRSLFGCLLHLHGPRCLFALFSAACFACMALVIFSLSFRPPAALCTALVIFSFSFRPLTSLARPSLSSVPFSDLLGLSWVSFCSSWALLGHFLALLGLSWPLLGRSWALLGGSWEALGGSWPLLGRSWNDIKKSSKLQCQK